MDAKQAIELLENRISSNGIKCLTDAEASQIVSTIESLAAKAEPNDGISLIAAERQRQINQEGWTAEHDQQWTHGELALAAACYALPEDYRYIDTYEGSTILKDALWPWHPEWWKPTPNDREREIVKACALLLAEFDRLRAGGGQG